MTDEDVYMKNKNAVINEIEMEVISTPMCARKGGIYAIMKNAESADTNT